MGVHERGAARGIWLNGLLSVPAGLLFFGLGIALFAWYQKNPEALAIGMKTDEVLPLFVATRLPAGIAGPVFAGVFAATLSSLDSGVHGTAPARPSAGRARWLGGSARLAAGAGDCRCCRVRPFGLRVRAIQFRVRPARAKRGLLPAGRYGSVAGRSPVSGERRARRGRG